MPLRRRQVALSSGVALALLIIFFGVMAASAPGAPVEIERNIKHPHVPDQILIRFKDGVAHSQRQAVRAALGARSLGRFGRSLEHLELGAGRTIEETIALYREHPLIEYIEPNYLYTLDKTPNDPRFPEMYGLRNVGQTGGFAGADIEAERAWELTTGEREVVVAVIDSGVDYTHPDLAANIWINPGEIPANGVDDDGNGFVDDVRGWNFADDNNDPMDDSGHGTHVAGTIGAVGDNAFGVSGVAWKVRIAPLKFIASNGFGTTTDAIAAIDYATSIGADITNNSWGGGAFSRALLEAIQHAGEAGVLFVASAGNQGQNTDSLPHYPSSYDAPNVVSVTATDHKDGRPLFANFGPRTVDLGAPGVNILSTFPGGTSGLNSGTSMAAPHVSGTAALVRSLAPYIAVVELKQLLLDNAEPVSSLGPLTVSGGRLNAFRVLSDRDEIAPGPIGDLTAGSPTSNAITLSWTATGDDGAQGAASVYEIRYDTVPIDEATFGLATRFPETLPPRPAGSTEELEVTGLVAGTTYFLALRARDEWGNPGPVSNVASATTLPAPTFASSPVAFEIELFAGATATRSLTVGNVGQGTLDWSLRQATLADWARVQPTAGRLYAGEQQLLTLEIDTRGLPAGGLDSSIEIETNDPFNPIVAHPLSLEVVAAPAIEVDPPALDFGEVFVGAAVTLSLRVANFGTDPLDVRDLSATGPRVAVEPSAFSLPAGDSRTVQVTYAPTEPVPLVDVLSIRSDAPNAPLIEVPLRGSAALPPAIRVEPGAFDVSVLAGEKITRTLRLTNGGDSPLVASFFFEPGSNPGPIPTSPLVNGGFETGDFTGWEATTNDLFTWVPWTASEAGGGWFENSEPIEGTFDALNGFDGQAGLIYDLAQDLRLPPGLTRATLTYYDRIQYDDLGSAGVFPKAYKAKIEDLAGNTLSTFVDEELVLDGSGYRDLGWTPRSVDLLPWAGQTVRLLLRQGIRETLVAPGQIEFDDFRIDIEGFPAWFRVDATGVTIAPGESAELDVIFDATDFLSERFDGFIRIETNVPSAPRLLVPAAMTIFGAPDIVVNGDPITVESTQSYSGSSARTAHTLPLPLPPGGAGTIELLVNGDLGDFDESSSLWVEGRSLGSMGNVGADCVPASRVFALSAEELGDLAADGLVEAEVQNNPNVAAVCAKNTHTVRLAYRARADRLVFGDVVVGAERERSIVVHNRGTDLLTGSITSDAPQFRPSSDLLNLAPGESTVVTVTFAPSSVAVFESVLAVVSNDPDTPRIEIALAGAGLVPPSIGVDPPSLQARVLPGNRELRTLIVSNAGGSRLDLLVEVLSSTAMFVSVEPVQAAVPPGGAIELGVTLDATGLSTGLYEALLEISSNDPAKPTTTVPISLEVIGAPRIALGGETVILGSSIDFAEPAARTVHALDIDSPPAGAAAVQLTADGEFGTADKLVTVTSEGMSLDTLGAAGSDCQPVSVSLQIAAAELETLAADGVVVVEMHNSEAVGVSCPTNNHSVELSYHRRVDKLDFGSVLLDSTRELPLVIENTGVESLEIDTVTSGSAEFSVATDPFSLSPGASRALSVSFAPPNVGPFGATLTITSNDPLSPLTEIPLVGIGTRPPEIEVDPLSIEASVPVGQSGSASLTLFNRGLGSLEFATSVAGEITASLGIRPVSGSIAPGDSTNLTIDLDASRLPGGVYLSTIEITSNDPLRPVLSIPVTLNVTGAGVPDLAVGAERVSLESSTSFASAGARTTHLLLVDDPPAGNGGLELIVQGDYGNPGETATATAEGLTIGAVGAAGADCSTVSNSFPIDFADLAALAQDGRIQIEIQNSPAVVDFCPVNAHTLRLSYHPAIESVDFGTAFIGSTRERTLTLENLGFETLQVASIATDTAEFETTVASLTLPPGSSRPVTLRFSPSDTTPFSGTLRIESNDPDTPLIELGLSGTGANEPRIGVDPDSITATILEGGRVTRALTISNTGSGPLQYSLDVAPAGAGFVRFDTAAGTVPAVDSAVVTVTLDTAGLQRGFYPVAIEVASNDPQQPVVTIPVSLTVAGAPDIAFLGEPVLLESTVDYFTASALTRHTLHLPVAPAGEGRVQLIAEGDFGVTGEFALLIVDGSVVGSVGAIGSDCAPAFGTFAFAADDFARITEDEMIEVRVQNTDIVDPICAVNRHIVRVSYDAQRDSFDFDTVFVGQSASRQIQILNRGSEMLEVDSITTDAAEFAPSTTRLTVAPGDSRLITVSFAPPAIGEFGATLTLITNDPDMPRLEIPLAGAGAEAPVIGVAPNELASTLFESERQNRTVSVSNGGGSPLEVSVVVGPPAGFEASFTLFGTDGANGNLYTIDPATAEASLVGPLGIRAPSLAVDPTTGVMYAGEGGGSAVLYTVDPASAVISFVADTGVGVLSGLDFTASGILFAAVNAIDDGGTGGDTLAIIDKTSGAATIVGTFGNGIGTEGGPGGIDGLAFDPSTDTLYGASGAQVRTGGGPSLYTIDPSTGTATPVGPIVDEGGEPVPGGVVSLQFDRDGALFGGTGQRRGQLVRIDPATAEFTSVGRAVTASLGGLALRENPPELSFVEAEPGSFTVPPSGRASLEVTFDARRVPPGTFGATITLTHNDPNQPPVHIPASLTVLGIPDIALPGQVFTLESSEDFFEIGAQTSHRFELGSERAGGATLELVADGDFGAASERARVSVDDLTLGFVGDAGADCFPATANFTLAATDLDALAGDGVVQVDIANPPTVSTFCSVNRHTVRLIYDAPRERLDFGTVFVGYRQTLPLTIRNDGRAELQISSVSADGPGVVMDSAAMRIPPFGSVSVPVTYAPTGVGQLAGTLLIASNDPDEPEVVIDLTGSSLVAPVAGVSPGEVETVLPPRGEIVAIETVRVTNTGGSDLVWNADLFEVIAPRPAAPPWSDRIKGDESDNGAGEWSFERLGGPDEYGYQFKDSDQPNGPAFEWVDIAQSGTPLGLSGDDENSGPIRIGFDFPFYGETFATLNISSNGWLSLTSEQTSYSNPDTLPNDGFTVPENLIAPFWDDLHLRGVERITYHNDGSRFIVQYTGVDRFASSSELTFQAILYPSGKMVFQYLSMSGTLDSASIGIQNGDRTIGLLVAYNEGYVHDGLAVEIARIAPWTTATPAAGVVPPGGQSEIDLEIRSRDLDAGEFHSELLIRSNDPRNGEIRVPVTLHTALIDLEHFDIDPDTVNVKSNGRWIRAALQLPAAYDPRDVVVSSVSLYDTLQPDASQVEYADETADGIDEVILRFDRGAFHELLPAGEVVEVTISGEVDGTVRFRGTTTVRVIGR